MFGLFRKRKPAAATAEAAGPQINVTFGIVSPTPEQEASWAKKREATSLSRAGDTGGAIAALEEAQRISGEAAQVPDEIRRAKYLQKDGRADEAWAIYAGILEASQSSWTDVDVLDAMRLHLQRDNQAGLAVHFGIAHRLACIELYRNMRREAEHALEGPMPDALKPIGDAALDMLLDGNRTWERMKDNHRFSIELADKWLGDLTDPGDLRRSIEALAKKAGLAEHVPALLQAVVEAIALERRARDWLSTEASAQGRPA
jgi:hypothetical protein